MLVRYTTSYKDFVAAQRLNVRRKFLGAARYNFFVYVLPVLSGLALLTLLFDIVVRHFSLPPWAGGVLSGLAFLGLYCSIYRVYIYRRLYRQMKNGRPELAPIEFELQGEELISRVPGFSEGRFLRTAIRDFAEDDAVVLLYLSPRAFLMLPRHAVSEPELADLRHWISNPPSSATRPASITSGPPAP